MSRKTLGLTRIQSSIAIIVIVVIAAGGGYFYYVSTLPKAPLVVDAWGGPWIGGVVAIGKDFTAQTGIPVQTIEQGATAEELQKIEAGTIKPDLWLTAAPQAYLISQNGMAISITPSSVPSLSQIPSKLWMNYSGQTYAVGFETEPIALAYVKSQISSITSWKDMWNPDIYQKGIMIMKPSFYQGSTVVATALAWHLDLSDTPGIFDKIKIIAPYFKSIMTTDSDIIKTLGSPTGALALAPLPDAFGSSRRSKRRLGNSLRRTILPGSRLRRCPKRSQPRRCNEVLGYAG